MQNVLVDTNVFMRLFDLSDRVQTVKSRNLFKKAAAGDITLVVGPPVLFELAWVLRSSLKLPNEEVLDVLQAIIAWQGVKVSDYEYAQSAISLAREKNQGFADAYLCVTAKKQDLKMATFNKTHFVKMGAPLYPLEE
jgi:predicted nucleic acid-binding protein